MSEINGTTVFVHVGLSRDVLCGLVVRVQVENWFCVAVKSQDCHYVFACCVASG